MLVHVHWPGQNMAFLLVDGPQLNCTNNKNRRKLGCYAVNQFKGSCGIVAELFSFLIGNWTWTFDLT